MKNVVWLLLLVSMLLVASIVEGEERPSTPPYQGPPGGYGSRELLTIFHGGCPHLSLYHHLSHLLHLQR
jgi:hypothetical protein